MTNETPTGDNSASARRGLVGLGLLFGAIYFIQGISEPTEGLVAQPVKSILRGWGKSAGEIALFSAIMALPWSLKPLFGLLSDFVPIFGTRRRSYLLLAAAMTAISLLYLFLFPVPKGSTGILLLLLLVPTFGVACSDVVVDALMVERGQPLGITGKLQSIQWAAMYSATILTGFLGGYLSQRGHQEVGFLICATVTAVSFFLTWYFVRESPSSATANALPETARALWGALRTRSVLAAAAFLFLWSFNPFSSTVQYVFMTEELGFSEEFYGQTVSWTAVGAVLGSVTYGLYCRRVPLLWLLHGAIVTGVISTLAYWWMDDKASAVLVSLVVGFTYMAASMIQFDLAARVCPPQVAGTIFATLMALTNFSLSASTWLGGVLYDSWSTHWGARPAFNALVAVGAAFTAGCWLLIPQFRRSLN